jgi:C1A family cysteine protease
MKTATTRFIITVIFITLILFGCSKSDEFNIQGDLQQAKSPTSVGTHVYGLLTTTPDQILGLPVYSQESLPSKLKLKSLATSVTLANPPVRDQGQIGSCTAFCGAETDEILYYYNKGVPFTNALSPAFLYYCMRVLILNQKIQSDNGAYMINIPQALKTYGDCLESSYPYPSSNKSPAYKTPPTSAAMTQGLNYQVGLNTQVNISYGTIPSGDLGTTKTFLSNNVPVMLGFNVYDNSSYSLFEGLNTVNYTYNPLTSGGSLVKGARLLGSHAVPIIGYDDNFTYPGGGQGAFLVQNSWGTSWGNKGFFYMPYSVFSNTKIVPSGNVFGMILE